MIPHKKGTPYWRIMKTIKRGDREWYYHATKGWRSRRA